MFTKCFLLLFVIGSFGREFINDSAPTASTACPYPRLDHGRFRISKRSKLVRYSCSPRYGLVGSRYSICRNGKWDMPPPVCVRPGCEVPTLANGLAIQSFGGAWLMFFCHPVYKIIGSPVLYCDGHRWNATTPVCVDSKIPPILKCDFEDPNLCGWMQDALHDFDWKRLNKGTPSSMLFTGPSYDHTFGMGALGYYMYIESTGRLKNDTARLLSPVYDWKLTKDGCFSLYLHMYGETTGGLKVYQKPDSVTLSNENKKQYLIFEKWGNQGDRWFHVVIPLRELNEDFQLIIEGIRGSSFTSDIAFDDVAILQGEECRVDTNYTTTTEVGFVSDSCAGRCGAPAPACGCSGACVVDGVCCPDFFDLCLFNNDVTTDESTTPEELSDYTQRLIAITTTSTTSTVTTVPTTKSTTIQKITTQQTTKKPTIRTTNVPKNNLTTSRKIPTLVFKSSTALYNIDNVKNQTTVTPRPTTKSTPLVTKKATTKSTTKATTKSIKTTTSLPFGISRTIENHNEYDAIIERKKKELETKIEKTATKQEDARTKMKTKVLQISDEPKGMSSIKTGFITIGVLVICAAAVMLILAGRSSKGREVIAKLQGRATSNQEVRYLTSNVEDDDDVE